MKDVKTPTSRSYHDYLISSLKNPQEAAVYLEAALEEAEPELLLKVLKNIAEAQAGNNNLSENSKVHHEKIDKLFSKGGGDEICTLVELLDALGFRIAIALK